MSESAQILNIVCLALIAVYVCIHAAQLISEVRSVESNLNAVPAPFASAISLAQHRKAIDYSADMVQCDVVNALVGCGLALALTIGGVINVLWAGIGTLWGQGLIAQFLLVSLITLTLALIDLPLTWYRLFHINERYGYEKTPSSDWFQKFFRQTLVGWVVELPIVLGILFLLTLSDYLWWIVADTITIGCVLWKFWIVPKFIVGHSKELEPIKDSQLELRLKLLLKEHGYPLATVFTHRQPKAMPHAHAILIHHGTQGKLIVFSDVLEKLSHDEILAIAACTIGRANRSHTIAKILFFSAVGTLFWWALALLSEKPWFYEAIGIHPSLAMINGAPVAGLLMALSITLIPVLLYPAVLLIHAFTRMLKYDEDAYAVHYVGAEPLVRALVKLHRDYRNTLTPNRFYSLCNHRRPHIYHRIMAAYEVAKVNRANVVRATGDVISDRSALYNRILARRRTVRERSRADALRRYDEAVLEYDQLQKRSKGLSHE